jgi:hypothetical protein
MTRHIHTTHGVAVPVREGVDYAVAIWCTPERPYKLYVVFDNKECLLGTYMTSETAHWVREFLLDWLRTEAQEYAFIRVPKQDVAEKVMLWCS